MFIFFVKIKVINIKEKNFWNEEGKKIDKKINDLFSESFAKKDEGIKVYQDIKKKEIINIYDL